MELHFLGARDNTSVTKNIWMLQNTQLKGYTSFYTFVVTASAGKLESQLAAGELGLGVERKPNDTHCWVVGLI